MARKTRSVKGRVYYFKRPYILHMKEDKPTVYKIQICRGRVVKEADFIAYAAGAAHVPETTMITAKHAIFEAINYFVLNGHAVQLEGLGSFSPRINSKTTQNPDEVGAEPSRQCHSPTWHHRQDEGTAQTEGQQPPRLRVFVIPR